MKMFQRILCLFRVHERQRQKRQRVRNDTLLRSGRDDSYVWQKEGMDPNRNESARKLDERGEKPAACNNFDSLTCYLISALFVPCFRFYFVPRIRTLQCLIAVLICSSLTSLSLIFAAWRRKSIFKSHGNCLLQFLLTSCVSECGTLSDSHSTPC